jgi:hypothetical protein
MHAPEIKDLFVQLRAKGWSIPRISAKLNVPERTCFEWQRENATLITDLQNAHIESINERVLTQYEEELASLNALATQVGAVLRERNFKYDQTSDLIRLLTSVRAEIRRARKNPVYSEKPAPVPPATSTAIELPANMEQNQNLNP